MNAFPRYSGISFLNFGEIGEWGYEIKILQDWDHQDEILNASVGKALPAII